MANARGHTGPCRTARRHRQEELADVAHEMERAFQGTFSAYEADLAVTPVRISHLASVGEGVGLYLVPHDAAESTDRGWWGFESDAEVFRRPRFGGRWEQVLAFDALDAWARSEILEYLGRLARGEGLPR